MNLPEMFAAEAQRLEHAEWQKLLSAIRCADCGKPITGQDEPPDGWELEDGRVVCGPCCAADLKRIVKHAAEAV